MPRSPYTMAVVTGGGSGLGAAFADRLVARGAAVVVADIDAARAAAKADAITAAGGRALAVACDVTDAAQVKALREQAVAWMGGLDVWINNAGVAVAGLVGEVPLDDWTWVMDVNLMGMVYGCHEAAPLLAAQGHGTLINVSSTAGLLSNPGMGPYNVSKAGVVALSETLYGELKSQGVRVTVVCPTFFQTDLLSTAPMTAGRYMKIASVAMKRSRYTAEDVAECALRDAEKGRLFSVAMADGRWLWRLRRLMPQRVYDLYGFVIKAVVVRKRP